MQEVDPCDFLLSAINDVSERLRGNYFLNPYQKYLLRKIQSELDGEKDLFFLKEDSVKPQCVKRDSAGNLVLSVYNCVTPLSDVDVFEETIASIAETGADVRGIA